MAKFGRPLGRASRFKRGGTICTSAVDFRFTTLLTGSQQFTGCHGGAPFAPLADMQSNAASASVHLRPLLLVHVAEPMRRLIARWADKRASKFRRELDLAYGSRLVAWRVWTGKEQS